jgi:hypothetical protein
MPFWVQVLQALAVPVIAAVGAWVALQQMHIARVKLQHDLYERRYAVFEAVRRFLDEAVSHKIVSRETYRSFALCTADAPFLFDDRLAAYLKEMREHAANAQSIYSVIEGLQDMPSDQKISAVSDARQAQPVAAALLVRASPASAALGGPAQRPARFLVLKCIRFIQCGALVLVFPAKAGTHFRHGHRPSPV